MPTLLVELFFSVDPQDDRSFIIQQVFDVIVATMQDSSEIQ